MLDIFNILFLFNGVRSITEDLCLDCPHSAGWIEERGRVLYHVLLVYNSGTAWTPSDWSFNRWILSPLRRQRRSRYGQFEEYSMRARKFWSPAVQAARENGHLDQAKKDTYQGVIPWQNGRVSARVSNWHKANGYTCNRCNWKDAEQIKTCSLWRGSSKTSGKG